MHVDWLATIRTEDDLKVRLFIPLLERLGVSRADMRLEESFTFKAGRQTLRESIANQLSEKRPRLDLLVTHSGRNLFIVEFKKPGVQLTTEDHLQAISYARLVHPIAPYAIVTNGSDSAIYDTVTRQPLSSSALRTRGYEAVLPAIDDFDALEYFLRLSPSNLQRFCQSQVDDAVLALLGSRDDLNKQFVPELHVPRAAIGHVLTSFRQAPEPVLALIADSGLGKTCCMCYRARALLAHLTPVLFFRGSELRGELLARLSDEFAWTFSETLSPPTLVRRLARVTTKTGLYIFIDGLDEWSDDSAYRQLGSLAKHLRGTGIKLVVSCKPTTWQASIRHRGAATDLAASVYAPKGDLGVRLDPLEDGEFWQAVSKYRSVYGFNGVWDKSLLDEAKRNPFFLRVAFDVARHHHLTELRESSLAVLERYFQGCLDKTRDVGLAERVLTATASVLLASNSDQVPMDQLRSALGLRMFEEIPNDLFDVGVLERIVTGHSVNVRFAYDGLRNHVIATKVRRWLEMSEDLFRNDITGLPADGPAQESLWAYYRYAPAAHQRVLDWHCYEPAARFLAAYKDIIEAHFRAFKASFPPGNLENVGLVLQANLRTGTPYSYGLRALEPGEEPVIIVPANGPTWLSHTLASYGAGGLANRIGVDWLHDVDPHQELLSVNFDRLIPEIIHAGGLNEHATPELAAELLAAAVVSKPELFGEPDAPATRESLPLTVGRIRHWLLFQQHWVRLENEVTEAKVASGSVPVRRHGSILSYSPPPMTKEERAAIRSRCEKLARRRADPGRPQYSPLDNVANRLRRAADALADEFTVDGPIFRGAESHRSWVTRSTVEDEEVQLNLRFMRTFLESYERLVESNFPTLKNHFALYRELPVLVLVAVHPLPHAPGPPTRGVLWEFFKPIGFTLERSEVNAVDLEFCRSLEYRVPTKIEGRLFSWFFGRSGSTDVLDGNRKHYPNLGLRSSQTILRDFVYWWIESELNTVGEALGAMYGIEQLRLRL